MIRTHECGASLGERYVSDKPDLREALRKADWDKLLPVLRAYAFHRLRRAGWAAGRDIEPSRMSVDQIVHTAIEHALTVREWNPEAVDLTGFLRGIIRSLTSSERKKEVRAKTFPKADLEEYLLVAESHESELVDEEGYRELCAEVEACTADDPDLQALYLAVIDGNVKRETIAEVLGWSVDRVTAARIKLQRRLVKKAPQRFADVRERRRRGTTS
jgi:hypothetical protein